MCWFVVWVCFNYLDFDVRYVGVVFVCAALFGMFDIDSFGYGFNVSELFDLV